MSLRHHMALHLAHRWFAFLEAVGGNLDAHLEIFHPDVQLSGRRGGHVFANGRESLVRWFASIPEEVSSHHIVHSSFVEVGGGVGQLSMVVAYQAPAPDGMHGSIISYQTRVEFSPKGARFLSLDKTPVLPNTRHGYQTSWAVNRVLARLHAELASPDPVDSRLRQALGTAISEVNVVVVAPEGARDYQAVVTVVGIEPNGVRVVTLALSDDVKSSMPTITHVEICATAPNRPEGALRQGTNPEPGI